MSELYPLLIEPVFHERVWGARDLRPVYDLQFDKPMGEAWLTGDECRVLNGPLAGATLGQLCGRFGDELVCQAAPAKGRFPLLTKFLFPRQKLSVQVHPDDEMARNMNQPCGKTECWYVLSAEPGAQVGVGLKKDVTREAFVEAIKNGTAEQLLNWIDVHPGDLVYVEAGTVHAIGPGSILVETQQNSDTTFRLYDYGRPRELHLEQGLAAMKEKTHSGKRERPTALPRDEANEYLLFCEHFTVSRFRLKGNNEAIVDGNKPEDRFARKLEVMIGLTGSGMIRPSFIEPKEYPEVGFKAGQAVILPPALRSWQLRCGAEGVETLCVTLHAA